jgi:hypothetical protein
MRRLVRLTLIAGATLLAGCADFEYGIVLEEDLSGTSTMDVTIDVDRIAYAGATMQRMFAGKEGPPTEEEIDAIRQELLEEMEEEGEEEFDEAKLRSEIEPDLPAGVELKSAAYEVEDLKRRVKLEFAFEDVASLNQLHIDAGDDESPMGDMDDTKPFEGLQVIDEGSTLVIRNEAINPMDLDEEEGSFMSGEMLKSMLEGLRIAFKIESPFEVLEHNATRVDGPVLYWEYTVETLSEDPEGIFVRYRK